MSSCFSAKSVEKSRGVNMIISTIALLVVSAIQITFVTTAADCNSLPQIDSPSSCCNFPKMNQAEFQKLMMDVQGLMFDVKTGLDECKLFESVAKKLNLIKDNNADENELIALLSRLLENPSTEWTLHVKTVVPECNKKVNAKLADIQTKMEAAPYNVKKDQCPVKYGAILTCILFNSFEKCPSNSWTESKNCSEAKQWANKCGDEIYSFVKFGFGKP